MIDLTNAWSKMATAPNVTEMRENIEINKFYIEEEKCVNK